MNHILIESDGIAKSVDSFLEKALSAIAIKNVNATKGLSGKICNLSRITSFQKLESLFDFNGIAYVLLRSKIIKEAEKLAMYGEFNPEDCLSQPVLLSIAAECGATPYLGQVDKEQMKKAYLHANWQIVAVKAWFAEHPGDELERFKLKTEGEYNIVRNFIIEKLYSRERTFSEFFDGTPYTKLCEKYDLGYGIKNGMSDQKQRSSTVYIYQSITQNNVTIASLDSKILEVMGNLTSIAERTESKIDSIRDNQDEYMKRLDDFEKQFLQYIKDADRPIKLNDVSCRKIAKFLSDMVDVTSGKESKNLSTNSIVSTIDKGFRELKMAISELAPEIIEELLDSAKTKSAYGMLVRIISIFNEGDGYELLDIINNSELGEQKEKELGEKAPIFIIKYDKMDDVFHRLFSKTKYNEKDQYSVYSRVRPYLKRYVDKENKIIEDIPVDSFNTNKSKNLLRPAPKK